MDRVNPFQKNRAAIVYAHSACLCLGLGLIFLGIAPAAVERVVTRQAPELLVIAAGLTSVLVGMLFVTLHVFIRRGARWAVWAGFIAGLLLVLGWFVASMATSRGFMSLALPVLAGATTVATWVALKVSAASARRNAQAPTVRPAMHNL